MLVYIQKSILMLHQNCIWCGSCWFIVCYYVLFMLSLIVLKVRDLTLRIWCGFSGFYETCTMWEKTCGFWRLWWKWTSILFVQFSVGKNNIERERPKLQLGWLQLCQNPIYDPWSIWWYIHWLAGVCPLHWCAPTIDRVVRPSPM